MPDEGGGLGLKVKITPVIDRSKLNSEAKKVEDQLNKNLKISGTGDFSKTFKNLMPKSFTNMMGSLGGGKASGGGLGKAALAGAVGGAVAVGVQGLMKGLMKLVHMVGESSPLLKAQLRMLNQGFMMILRPFADTIAMMLRPVGLFFRVIGRDVMKRMKAKRAEYRAEGITGAALGMSLMGDYPSVFLDVLTENLNKLDWAGMFVKFGNIFWDTLTTKFPEFLTKLDSTGGLILAAVMVAIGTMAVLSTLGALILTQAMLSIGTMAALGTFATLLLPAILVSIGAMMVLGDLGQDIYDLIMGRVRDGADKGYVNTSDQNGNRTNIPSNGAGGPAIDTSGWSGDSKVNTSLGKSGGDIWSVPKQIYNFLGGSGPLIKGLAGGGEVMSEGLVNLHPGEVVKDKGNIESMITRAVGNAMASMGSGGNATIVIPGSVLADAMDRRIDAYYRTKVTSRR